MKQHRIGTFDSRRKYKYTPKTFAETVKSMVYLFDGFELGDNAILMNIGDCMRLKSQFTIKDGGLMLGDIPVFASSNVPKGQAFLTNIEKARTEQ